MDEIQRLREQVSTLSAALTAVTRDASTSLGAVLASVYSGGVGDDVVSSVEDVVAAHNAATLRLQSSLATASLRATVVDTASETKGKDGADADAVFSSMAADLDNARNEAAVLAASVATFIKAAASESPGALRRAMRRAISSAHDEDSLDGDGAPRALNTILERATDALRSERDDDETTWLTRQMENHPHRTASVSLAQLQSPRAVAGVTGVASAWQPSLLGGVESATLALQLSALEDACAELEVPRAERDPSHVGNHAVSGRHIARVHGRLGDPVPWTEMSGDTAGSDAHGDGFVSQLNENVVVEPPSSGAVAAPASMASTASRQSPPHASAAAFASHPLPLHVVEGMQRLRGSIADAEKHIAALSTRKSRQSSGGGRGRSIDPLHGVRAGKDIAAGTPIMSDASACGGDDASIATRDEAIRGATAAARLPPLRARLSKGAVSHLHRQGGTSTSPASDEAAQQGAPQRCATPSPAAAAGGDSQQQHEAQVVLPNDSTSSLLARQVASMGAVLTSGDAHRASLRAALEAERRSRAELLELLAIERTGREAAERARDVANAAARTAADSAEDATAQLRAATAAVTAANDRADAAQAARDYAVADASKVKAAADAAVAEMRKRVEEVEARTHRDAGSASQVRDAAERARLLDAQLLTERVSLAAANAQLDQQKEAIAQLRRQQQDLQLALNAAHAQREAGEAQIQSLETALRRACDDADMAMRRAVAAEARAEAAAALSASPLRRDRRAVHGSTAQPPTAALAAAAAARDGAAAAVAISELREEINRLRFDNAALVADVEEARASEASVRAQLGRERHSEGGRIAARDQIPPWAEPVVERDRDGRDATADTNSSLGSRTQHARSPFTPPSIREIQRQQEWQQPAVDPLFPVAQARHGYGGRNPSRATSPASVRHASDAEPRARGASELDRDDSASQAIASLIDDRISATQEARFAESIAARASHAKRTAPAGSRAHGLLLRRIDIPVAVQPNATSGVSHKSHHEPPRLRGTGWA